MRTLLQNLMSHIFIKRNDARILENASLKTFREHVTLKEQNGTEALLSYRSKLVGAAIRELKYHDNAHAGVILGEFFREMILDTLSVPYILVPMPLSKQRLRERGYNQVARIARVAVKDVALVTLREDVLTRTHSVSQTKLRGEARRHNLDGVFFVAKPEEVKGKNIMLLDDVVTTGTTMNAARKALRKAGARRVRAIAIAH